MMTDIERVARAGIALAVVGVLGWLGGCSDNPVDPDIEPPPPQGLILSDPVLAGGVASRATSAPVLLLNGAEDSVAFVSLPLGTVPNGSVATIRGVGNADMIFATVRDGGFDPVPVAAQAGDSIDVRVTSAGGATLLMLRVGVAKTRPPIVVRTEPPRKKKDVPLNSAIIIVFSEPVTEATLSGSSVQLFRGTSAVAGTVRLLQGTGAAAAFIPDAPLDRNTDYRLVVTRAVQDLEGDALEAGVTVEFRTGQASTGPAASITVSPDSLYLTVFDTYQLTATVRDAAGNLLIDQPVTWSTGDPGAPLTVSGTGLVTAQAPGSFDVFATVNGLTHGTRINVRAGASASVTLSPAADTVAARDTIWLSATVRDTSGFVVDCPVLNWSSSDPAVAVVLPVPGFCDVRVAGVSAGSVTITATSGSAQGTASVNVLPPPPAPRFTDASAGFGHSCGLTVEGDAYCWGRNNVGQLGRWDPTVEYHTQPAHVHGGLTFAALSTNAGHVTCGITGVGDAYCWGLNDHGQVGNGQVGNPDFEKYGFGVYSPSRVLGGLTFMAVAPAMYHTCGLTTAAAVYCWGRNDYGQLGDGTTTSSSTPVPVRSALAFAAVTTGAYHSCAVTTAGAVHCWGDNVGGQLGNGTTTPSSIPVAVPSDSTFVTVSARFHTCAVTAAGTAYCWGPNQSGVLGDGTTASTTTPVPVAGGLAFVSIDAGWTHTCGVTASGAAYCWGNNFFAQLGDGTTTGHLTPTAVTGGLTFASVTGGYPHSCGVTTANVAYCWGNNFGGELGDGTRTNSLVPVKVAGQP
jgi:alpha-tubulin suppressor-like RCC1 family protein